MKKSRSIEKPGFRSSWGAVARGSSGASVLEEIAVDFAVFVSLDGALDGTGCYLIPISAPRTASANIAALVNY